MGITDIIQTVFSVLGVLLMWSNRKPLCRMILNAFHIVHASSSAVLASVYRRVLEYATACNRASHEDDTQENIQLAQIWNVHILDLERQLTEGTMEWEESLQLSWSESRELE